MQLPTVTQLEIFLFSIKKEYENKISSSFKHFNKAVSYDDKQIRLLSSIIQLLYK